MKLKVKESAYTVKPKQTEGKLVVRNNSWRVQPKPRGVKLFLAKQNSVIKHDRRSGVKIEKTQTNKILKQVD